MNGDDGRDDPRSADDMAKLAPSNVVRMAAKNAKPEVCALMQEVPVTARVLRGPRVHRLGCAISLILPRGSVTLFSGHGGLGKSYILLVILLHAACGAAIAGFMPQGPLKCTYVSLEDAPDEVLARVQRIVDAYGLDAELVAQNLRIIDGTDTDGALAFEVNSFGVRSLQFTALMEQVEELALTADVLAIDNASDAFDADENSRRLVRAFIRRLARIARQCRNAVVLLAHVDKSAARYGSNGQSYVGSVAWHNATRSRLALVAAHGGGVELRHEKTNFGPDAETVTFRWRDGVPMPARGADGDAQRATDEDDAVRLVRAAIASGIAMLCAVTGAHTGWHATKHLPEAAPFADRKTNGPQRLFTALESAGRHGRLRRVTEKDQHRNLRDVWKLSETAEALNALRGGSDVSTTVKEALNGARASAPHTPPINARTRAGSARVGASKDSKTH